MRVRQLVVSFSAFAFRFQVAYALEARKRLENSCFGVSVRVFCYRTTVPVLSIG